MAGRFRTVRHHVGYYAFRWFLAAGGLLPLAVLRPFGAMLGRFAPTIAGKARRDALEHLQVAFPELSHEQRMGIVRSSGRHLGVTFAEVVWLWRARSAQVDALCSISGLEHLTEARAAGRGAVLLTAHCGNWELLNARLCTAGIPMTIAVREVYDSRIDHLATRLRGRFGTEVVARGRHAGKQLASALGRNRVNGLLIDQDIRDIPGVFVPFFGREAWTPSGAAGLALKVGCPITPAFVHRLEDGRHQAEIHPPLPIPDSGSLNDRIRELTAAGTACIERQIRAYPAQWVWMHRRWRTRPEEVQASSQG